MLLLMIIGQLCVVGAVLGGARDQDATVQRLDALRAQYAADSGIHMAVRELMVSADQDGDGTIGSVSGDGITSNDPSLTGGARFSVTKSGSSTVIITSQGRSGSARRSISLTIQ
jgi:hypothetical protein